MPSLVVGYIEHPLFQTYTAYLTQLFLCYISDCDGVASSTCTELIHFINFTIHSNSLELSSRPLFSFSILCRHHVEHCIDCHLPQLPQCTSSCTVCKDIIPCSQFLHVHDICSQSEASHSGICSVNVASPMQLWKEAPPVSLLSHSYALDPLPLGWNNDSFPGPHLSPHQLAHPTHHSPTFPTTFNETSHIFPPPPHSTFCRYNSPQLNSLIPSHPTFRRCYTPPITALQDETEIHLHLFQTQYGLFYVNKIKHRRGNYSLNSCTAFLGLLDSQLTMKPFSS